VIRTGNSHDTEEFPRMIKLARLLSGPERL
jgi:hypothetical protein